MSKSLRVSLVQLNCGPVIADNLPVTEKLVRQAADSGAKLVCTPENTCHIRFASADKLRSSLPEAGHPVLRSLAAMARENGIWILIGSISVKVSEDKIANRSFLLSDKGDIVARYDKIHLFDVDLPTGESHRESASVKAGEKVVVAQTPWGGMGMSICYDLRFAYLYRKMAQAGAVIMTVPAAFTIPTGQAHWEVLLRARAIETGSFVLAPGQCGMHEGGRGTYGHSLIVGPWGEVLAQGTGDQPGIITADIDISAVEKARSAIPALKHDRQLIQ